MPNSFKFDKPWIVALIFLLVLAVVIQPCPAQEDNSAKVVEAIGSSRIYGDNLPAARELAISNALVSAVARISLELMPLSSQVDQFKQVNELLYDQIDTYIQDYKVLTEFMSGENYRALVQVTVMRDKLEADFLDAGLLKKETRIPKVLLFVAEKNIGDILPMYWWGEDLMFLVPPSERALNDALREKQFVVVSHADITEPLNYDLTLGVQDAVALGIHRAADIVVVGRAMAETTTNVMGGNIKSFTAGIEVKAFRTDSGTEIAASTQSAVSAAVDEIEGGRQALYEAGLKAGKELALQIAAAWADQNQARKIVEINVHGTSELVNFVRFRKILGKIKGVSAIHILELKPDESTISVDYDGSAKGLAEELMLHTFESFGLDIYEVLPGKLGIELIAG